MDESFVPVTVGDELELFQRSSKAPYLIVAITLDSVSPALAEVQGSLELIDSSQLYCPPTSFHVTLKELGWLDEIGSSTSVRWIENRLKDVCSDFPSFRMKVGGLRYFPRAIYCTVTNPSPVKSLHMAILNGLKERIMTYPFEAGRFIPHVTLLYFKSKKVKRLLKATKTMGDNRVGVVNVSSVSLVYWYSHLLLGRSAELRAKSFQIMKRFKLGNRVNS